MTQHNKKIYAKMVAVASTQSIDTLKGLAISLNASFDEPEAVMSSVLDALMAKMPERDFCDFCDNLD